MPESLPAAQGTALKQEDVPTFSNVVVAHETWKSKSATEHKEFRGGAKGRTVNVTFANPGREVTCEWAIVDGQTAPKKGDVVSATGGEKYLIIECEDLGFGDGVRMQSVTLMQRDGLTLT